MRTTPTGSLFPPRTLDRYYLAPCAEQLTEGSCDCTRRIAREVEEATRRALASFATDGYDPRSEWFDDGTGQVVQ